MTLFSSSSFFSPFLAMAFSSLHAKVREGFFFLSLSLFALFFLYKKTLLLLLLASSIYASS